MRQATVEKERLNLYLPKPLVDDLRRQVPARQRTRFVREALAQALRRRQLRAAIAASAGAWHDEDHPDLASGPEIDRWVTEERAALGWDRPQEPDHA